MLKILNRASLPEPLTYFQGELKIKRHNPKSVMAYCPFHKDGCEKNASFLFDPKDGHFICFTCGVKGRDIISFHQLRYNLSFYEACRSLEVEMGEVL